MKKILPGCEYIQYWYDKGDRLMFMQDSRLRAQNRYRFYFYDKQGRLAVQGLCSGCNRGNYYGFVSYGPTGEGLCSTGYTLSKGDAVTGAVELELCNYYDDYGYLPKAPANRNKLLPKRQDQDLHVCLPKHKDCSPERVPYNCREYSQASKLAFLRQVPLRARA